MINASVLNSFGVFKGLDNGELARVAELCDERALKKDERIFSEGMRATHLHLCRSGKVDIVVWVREPWSKNVMVHQAGAGELFGWSAIVAPYTYTASAECVEAGEEIRIKGLDLLKLLDYNPHMGSIIWRNISAEISARLTQTRQRLSAEWLTSGVTSLAGSRAWGEPGRR